MGSPTQGMWVCKHGVDGRDDCWDCFDADPGAILPSEARRPRAADSEPSRAILLGYADDGSPVRHEDPPPVQHATKPLDGNEDTFRCSCGEVFVSSTGYAICPRVLKNLSAARSEPYRPQRGDAVEAWLLKIRSAWDPAKVAEETGPASAAHARTVWTVLDSLLENYWEHADMEVPLDQEL